MGSNSGWWVRAEQLREEDYRPAQAGPRARPLGFTLICWRVVEMIAIMGAGYNLGRHVIWTTHHDFSYLLPVAVLLYFAYWVRDGSTRGHWTREQALHGR